MIIAPLKFPPLPNRETNKLNLQPPKLISQYRDSSVQRIRPAPIQSTPQSSNRSLDSRRPQSTKSNFTNKSRQSSNDSKYSQKEGQIRQKMVNLYGQSMPKVTAKSWILFQLRQGKRIWGRRTNKKRQIASLTKIINLITILQILEFLKVNAHKLYIKATSTACSMTGTSAQLQPLCQYSLYDLFYGMMLPSGNDAAYLIAQIGGYLLSTKGTNLWNNYSFQGLNNAIQSNSNEYVNIFLKQMNYTVKKLFMHSTFLANPHGLSNTNSYSNSDDLAKLCSYVMRNNTFRKIVQTQKHHFSYIKYSNYQKQQISPEISLQQPFQDIQSIQIMSKPLKCSGIWQNTNKLLDSNWSGIKTGITPNAGPCLSASVVKSLNGRQYQFLVILLCSDSMQARWKEADELVNWAISNRLYI